MYAMHKSDQELLLRIHLFENIWSQPHTLVQTICLYSIQTSNFATVCSYIILLL